MKKANRSEAEFENALDRLEEIIELLQDGSLSLDESLKVFEEGIGLVRICQEKLDSAETKVSLLLKDSEGKMSEVPFDLETGK